MPHHREEEGPQFASQGEARKPREEVAEDFLQHVLGVGRLAAVAPRQGKLWGRLIRFRI